MQTSSFSNAIFEVLTALFPRMHVYCDYKLLLDELLKTFRRRILSKRRDALSRRYVVIYQKTCGLRLITLLATVLNYGRFEYLFVHCYQCNTTGCGPG